MYKEIEWHFREPFKLLTFFGYCGGLGGGSPSEAKCKFLVTGIGQRFYWTQLLVVTLPNH